MPSTRNRLIELLPAADRQRFLNSCEQVRLARSRILWEQGEVMGHVYFLDEGLISLMALMERRSALEVAMIGREGVVGIQVALGVVNAPVQAVVQVEGWAWRMDRTSFQAQLAGCLPLKAMLDRYAAVLMTQLATSATCLRYHEVGPRLARWLLMNQDRVGPSRLNITHDQLGTFLGVRRVSVTTAASDLQRRGLIEYRRGDLQVLDRQGLEAVSCGCYEIGRTHYADAFD